MEDEREKIIESLTGAINDSVTRMILGGEITSISSQTAASQSPSLTLTHFQAMHDYFKVEKLALKGETHEIVGWKVHQGTEGVTVLTEKLKPGSMELGKMVMIFEEEGKAVIYDPAKVKPEPPSFEMPRLDWGFNFAVGIHAAPSPFLPRARRVIEEKWPELICGPDDFFEVYDIVDDGR
jgi:hypothetical protein